MSGGVRPAHVSWRLRLWVTTRVGVCCSSTTATGDGELGAVVRRDVGRNERGIIGPVWYLALALAITGALFVVARRRRSQGRRGYVFVRGIILGALVVGLIVRAAR